MKVLILCNGLPPSQGLFESFFVKSDLFIAADGGGNVARDFGTPPDYVIGDLDSFREVPGEHMQVIHDPDQETNDLEKALDLANKQGARTVSVLGATGHRLDHTLNNLSVMKKYDERFESLRAYDDFGQTFLLPRSFKSNLEIGTILSLFPLSGRVNGITTRGLKFPLDDESLENGIRDGLSNEIIETPVEITYKSGDLFLFIAREKNKA